MNLPGVIRRNTSLLETRIPSAQGTDFHSSEEVVDRMLERNKFPRDFVFFGPNSDHGLKRTDAD
jgi:hypothetical protein